MTHAFRVWAPNASTVEVVIAESRHRLPPADGGWFEGPVARAGAGTPYAFSLDGGPPRPDPRSASQPFGVDGPSVVIDHGAFGWTDRGWRGLPLASAVLYELHVGTFTPEGTFDGVITKLPHLVALGVDAIELMPVSEFPGERGWGYDGVDLFAPHHGYGGPDGLKRLVDACHDAGIAIIVDVVYNHLGPAGNYLAEFGPYFTDKYTTPWGMAVNLDERGSDEVRRFFLDNARMWLRDYHFDGLRLDAVDWIIDTSATHLLEELAMEVDALQAALGRSLWLIAESDLNDPRVVASHEVGGYGIHAQWSDDFHHALHAVLTGERAGYYADFGSLAQVATALRRAFVYAGEFSVARGRRHGRSPVGVPGYRFLGYAQTHDQVGNRAGGERLSQLVGVGRLKIAAALVMTSPFVPMLFMGEEWGASTPFGYFTDHQDSALGRAVTDGRRREFADFGWAPDDVPDPQDEATFTRSKLDWAEANGEAHAELLNWHRHLIALRRRHPDLADGRLDRVAVVVDEERCHLELHRSGVTVLVNLGPEPWLVGSAGPMVVVPPVDLAILD